MDAHAWIAVGTLLGAAFLFIVKWVPVGITALTIPVVLVATGVIEEPQQALAGFGNHAAIAIGAIFVVSGALQESGVATLVARGLHRIGGRREVGLVVGVMLMTALLSSFMNNAAAVALLLPAVVTLSRRSLVSASRLLMPLGFASVLGGTVTMIGTAPNLLIADQLRTATGEMLGVFDFAIVGLPIVVMGVLYMLTIGRRLLPHRSAEDRLREARLPEEVAQSYGIERNMFLMRVIPQSHVVGKTLSEAGIRSKYGLSVVMVVRPKTFGTRRIIEPRADLRFEPEDRLYLEGEDVAAWHFAEEETLQFGLAGPQGIEKMLGRGVALAEVTVPPRSDAVGKSLHDLEFRKRFGLNVLSLWRRGKAMREDATRLPLAVGDAFLVAGTMRRVQDLARDADFIVLTDPAGLEDVRRAPLAVLILLVAVLPAVAGFVPISISALAAALLAVLTGCISRMGLRHALDWNVLALIAGTIPLGAALKDTGVAAMAAHSLLDAVAPIGMPAVLGGLFALAACVAMLSTNAAAAVIVAPVALEAAATGTVDAHVAMLAVAYGCSCAFVLPFAQWNLLVMGPAGYRAGDYFRVGLGMSLVMAATAIGCLVLLA